MKSRIRRTLDDWFAIDLRSLAAFRIALASVFLFDLASRAGDLRAHYTDAGILPARILEEFSGTGIRFSLHYALSHSEWAIVGLFVLGCLAGAALFLGYRTRIATFACWLLLASLQVRNPYLASMGGDNLLRILLTWSLLLPLGARYSLDATRDPGLRRTSNRLRSIPAVGLLFQVCLVYWVTGLKKNGVTWSDGSAVYYALHLDYWATSFGAALREQGWLLPFATYATRWFELLGPFLAFSPIFTAQLRLLAIGLFAVFHVVLALSFSIGMFPLVSMVGWFAFLPTLFWDRVLPGSAKKKRAMTDSALPNPRTPVIAQVAGLALLVYVVTLLAIQLGWLGLRMPQPIGQLASALRVQQAWGMFSPDPPAMDIWPVVTGTMKNGESIDFFRETTPSFEKPEDIAATLPSFRWRLYFDSLAAIRPDDRRFEPTYRGLARYLCREWNDSHTGQRQVRDVSVSMVIEVTRATHEEDPKPFLLYEVSCAAAQRAP